MQALYKDKAEETLNLRAIERLALNVHLPVERVKTAYEREFALLKSDAKVMDFIGLFASKRARETLLHT